ncbi:MAG: protein kinase domain-containing protein [Myxococcota bacterium]
MDGSHEPPSHRRCPRCGCALQPLSTQAPECPRCWFAIASGPTNSLGKYELFGEIGEGGSAVVHLAHDPESNQLFALKLAKPGVKHADWVFQNELRTARQLQGRNTGIVQVVDHGISSSGQAYLVMELMEGGSLADAVARGEYRDRRGILELIGKLASTLVYAHRRAVLHCDLKPENILFDAKGEPHVADFGVAQQLEDSGCAAVTAWGGSRGWMSPEQAERRLLASDSRENTTASFVTRRADTQSETTTVPELRALTVASDVFSLGVLLYWLLTGEMPFGKGADFEQRLLSEETPPPIPRQRWSSELDWEIASICQRALAKRLPDPNASSNEGYFRYHSAAELADDVKRALAGMPISRESSRPLRRLAKCVNRHRLLALAGLELCLLLLYLPLVPFLVLGQTRSVIEEQNSNAALHQAGAVMNELHAFGDHLRTMAESPEVQALVNHPDLFSRADELSRHVSGDIDNFVVFSTNGDLRARWPAPPRVERLLNFAFRDYFKGSTGLAKDNLRQMYFGRAIRSTTSGKLEIEPSTPMYDKSGRFVGVLGGARPARSTFGAVQMNCAGAGTCMTGLLAARDRDVPEGEQPKSLIFLAAPELPTGTEVALDLGLSQRICRAVGCTPAPRNQLVADPKAKVFVEDFVDPVSGTPSLGAFAPVGKTGLIVVVATPHSAVRGLTDRMLSKARSYLGVPLLIGLSLFGLLLASLRLIWPKLPADSA